MERVDPVQSDGWHDATPNSWLRVPRSANRHIPYTAWEPILLAYDGVRSVVSPVAIVIRDSL